ncbi:MAG: aspartate/tyrosine/aromatic aminotransferase, partial [Kangiellaceae bacterium]|nr:aspartate/tyrosine/aromatic aminotransferase [Kangiellaceae bacterium]
MFDRLSALPADPLLGLITMFRDDPNPKKVDLGVGVYRDESGHTPIMTAVQKAAQLHMETEDSKTYIGPGGVIGFVEGIKSLVLGADSSALKDNRVAGLQCPGGCGSLRVASELLVRLKEELTVWVSDPTWANHIPLISSAGLPIKTYPYFDPTTGGVNFEAMEAQLSQLGPKDVVLLHGCCHNPTGADLTFENWKRVAELAAEKGFMPFVDIAYQGLGDGINEDVQGVRYLSEKVEEMIIATSCSKNFGLYRDRIGACSIIGKDAVSADIISSVLLSVVRVNYSMPPAHGAAIVETILDSAELTTQWHGELKEMRDRINGMRQLLVD